MTGGGREGRRQGRGRLSSIDLLPPEADPHIQWAVQELAGNSRSQADILFELNDRLAVVGCGPISSSAFNRFSLRKNATLRKLAETREIAAVVTEQLGPERGDDVTVMIVQLIKEAIHATLENGSVGTKGVMELARALSAAVSAQRMSADARRAMQEEMRSRIDKAVETVAGEVERAGHKVDAAEVLRLIRKAYGTDE